MTTKEKPKDSKVQIQAWTSQDARKNLNRIMECPGMTSQAKAIEFALQLTVDYLAKIGV